MRTIITLLLVASGCTTSVADETCLGDRCATAIGAKADRAAFEGAAVVHPYGVIPPITVRTLRSIPDVEGRPAPRWFQRGEIVSVPQHFASNRPYDDVVCSLSFMYNTGAPLEPGAFRLHAPMPTEVEEGVRFLVIDGTLRHVDNISCYPRAGERLTYGDIGRAFGSYLTLETRTPAGEAGQVHLDAEPATRWEAFVECERLGYRTATYEDIDVLRYDDPSLATDACVWVAGNDGLESLQITAEEVRAGQEWECQTVCIDDPSRVIAREDRLPDLVMSLEEGREEFFRHERALAAQGFTRMTFLRTNGWQGDLTAQYSDASGVPCKLIESRRREYGMIEVTTRLCSEAGVP